MRGNLLTSKSCDEVEAWLRRRLAIPGISPGRLAADDVEREVARIVGCKWVEGKGVWDALEAKQRLGVEIKLLQNHRRRDMAVLTRIHPDLVNAGKERDPQEAAYSLLAAFEKRHREACASLGVEDSRFLFLYGIDAGERLAVWEEPYEPRAAELVAAHEWHWRPGSLAGTRQGSIRWEWYPRYGHLRFRPEPPARARRIDLPQLSLDPELFDRMMDELIENAGY